jgi:hypothetical protein
MWNNDAPQFNTIMQKGGPGVFAFRIGKSLTSGYIIKSDPESYAARMAGAPYTYGVRKMSTAFPRRIKVSGEMRKLFKGLGQPSSWPSKNPLSRTPVNSDDEGADILSYLMKSPQNAL